jgi:hypothetical protein
MIIKIMYLYFICDWKLLQILKKKSFVIVLFILPSLYTYQLNDFSFILILKKHTCITLFFNVWV